MSERAVARQMITKAPVRAKIGRVAALRVLAGVGLGILAPTSASAQLANVFAPRSCAAIVPPPIAAPDGSLVNTPIYIAGPDSALGSSGGQAVVIALGTAIANTKTPFPIVYVSVPSCAALHAVVNGTAAGATANYVLPGGSLAACSASGVVADLAISDVYGDTCAPGLVTAAQVDVFGPVSVTTLVVPFASTEQSISADAAYVVFGFGGTQYAVKPWTDPNSIFEPIATSGPLALVGAALGLAPNKWAAPQVSLGSLSAEVKAVSGGKANAAIGILPAPAAQANPTSLKVLAYEHSTQGCGYLPDSDPLHADRINVRQGRYALWGPLHFVANVDGMGNPLDHTGQPSAELATILNLLRATGLASADPSNPGNLAASVSASVTADAKLAIIEAESAAGLVPWCAMQVTRDGEIGAEASYDPPEPCGCAFESSVGSTLGTRRCATCTSDAECELVAGAPKCSYGYCEAP
jgi:hypothetical protein